MKEVSNLSNKEYKLVNRTKLGTAVDNKILAVFRQFAKESRIKQSTLLDEAITDLLKKYGYEIKE